MQIPNTRTGSSPLGALIPILVLFLVCGCATNRPEPWKNTAILDMPYDRVWSAAVESSRSVAPEVDVDALAGIIRTPYIEVKEDEVPFEQSAREPGVFHDWSTRRFRARYEIRRLSDAKTQVSVACSFSAYSKDARRWLVWPSNGKYEEFLVSKLRNTLQQGTNTAAR